MKLFVRLMVVAGVLPIASRVMAQETDLARPWGGSVTVGGQYTDNRDGLKASKTSNVDLYIEPRADYYLRDGERTTLNFFLSPLAKWHSDPREASEGEAQNDTELFGSGGFDLTHELDPRLSLKINNTLTYNDAPTADQGGTAIRQSASHIRNGAYGNISAEIAPQIALDFIGRSTIKRYSDDVLAKDQDENTLDTEGDIGYLLGSGYKVFLMAGYSSFDNESTTRNRGATISSFGAGVERYFSAGVSARLSGGYQDAKYGDEKLGSINTANGKAELVFRPKSATRFRLGGLYGYYTPYVRPYSVQKLLGVQGAIERDLLPERLTVALRGQVANGDYENEGADAPGGTDKLASCGLDATYRLNRNWAASAGYTYEKWDSDVRESFDRNFIDAGVKASF